MPRKTPTLPRRPGTTITQPNGATPREAPPPVNPGSRKPPGTPRKPAEKS